MDAEKWREAARRFFSKDRGVKLLVLTGVCGIVLICLSTWLGNGKKEEVSWEEGSLPAFSDEYGERLEQELARIVRAITGEESPEVLVTLENGGRTVYAVDEKTDTQQEEGGKNAEERETAHVILKDPDGAQQALTVTEIHPKVKGVVIVSSRAGDPVIREKVTEAVKTALDVSSAKVCVTDTG